MTSESGYWPVFFPFAAGFLFLGASALLFRQGKLLFGAVFFVCALVLFFTSLHHYRVRGTPEYGKPITTEDWGMMPAWKKAVVIALITIFLLFWGYLVVIGITTQGIHLENLCIGECEGL
ncbi:MAG: hypothetical protein LUO98_04555 [Methanoregula sp.]|nr:hypothetical protein [Methanoregula sp.]